MIVSPRKAHAAGSVTLVRFTGSKASLDTDTVLQVGDELLDLADESSGADLLLDFSNVDYVSSLGSAPWSTCTKCWRLTAGT